MRTMSPVPNGWRRALGPDVSPLDVAIGVVLGLGGIALVTGVIPSPGHHGGLAASLAVLTMTVPVVWRRRAPVVVAGVLCGGAVFNALVIGPMVRCGPALPALLLCAFALGRRDSRDRRATAVAIAALIGSAAVQSVSDPNLTPIILVALTPIIVALWAIGRAVTARSAVVARLAQRHDELRRQRRRTAELATQADRARIAEGLEDELHVKIAQMARAAEVGQAAARLDAGSAATQDAFAAIEHHGRDTLRHMRQVVGTLLDAPPKRPQPDISQLAELVTGSDHADVQLSVVGRRRELPPSLELSAYRTVEHLLDAFAAGPGGPIAITVDFGADSLRVTVRGPAPAPVEQQAALAASEARVALHSGALSSTHPDGQWEAVARLPLPAYA